MNKKGKY